MVELLLFLLALVAVTLIGHGIWVACAAMIRALVSEGRPLPRLEPGRSRAVAHCPACDTRLRRGELDCPACGLDMESSLAGELREVEIAIRQVRALEAASDQDEATRTNILQQFRQRRRTLLKEPEPRPEPTRRRAEIPPPPQKGEVETVRVPPIPVSRPNNLEEIQEALPAEPESFPVLEPVAPVPEPSPEPELAAVSLVHPPTMTGADEQPAPPPPPARQGNVLAAFMEERNILWGELVGGLLIVGCSIALVLTLWRTLQTIPYFPSLVFAVLTAALFGAGQYTLHHWKLQSTSRGLLIIAMLLAPLNLLVLADPSARGATPDIPWLDFAVDAGALLIFLVLVRAAGRDLIGVGVLPGPIDRRWLLALAVVGAAGSQLLTPHLLHGPEIDQVGTWFLALGCIPASFHLLACGAVIAGLTLYDRRGSLSGQQANALFAFLGLAGFSLLSAFTFLLSRLPHVGPGLALLACPLLLSGVPALAGGLVVYRKLPGDENAGARTAGTGIALAGLGIMFAGIVLAWPAPVALLLALLLAGGVLTTAAFTARVPLAHVASVPCLALAGIIGFYLGNGELLPRTASTGRLLELLTSANTSLILTGVAAILAALACWLRGSQKQQAIVLGWMGLIGGGLALLITTAHGRAQPLTAAAVHAACLLVGLLASLQWRTPVLAHVALVLLVPGTLWALSGWYPGQLALWGMVLALETLTLLLAALLPGRWSLDPLPAAAERVGLFTGTLALLLAVISGTFPREAIHTLTMTTLALALLVQSLHTRSQGWFTTFQAGLIASVLCGVTAFASPRQWLSDARGLQAYGVGLALLSFAWVAARRLMVRWPTLHALLPTSWPGLDRLLLGGLVLGQLVLAGTAAVPGVYAEWVPVEGIAMLPEITGPGSWLLLGILTATLLALLVKPAGQQEQRLREITVLGLLLLLLAATGLWAGIHIVDLATASALRWGLAGCFLAGSVLVWLRQPLAGITDRLYLAPVSATGEFRVLLGATAIVVVFLTAILTGLGFSGDVLPGPLPGSIFKRMGSVLSSIGPLALVIIGLVGTAIRERMPGQALAASILATVSAMGGYALAAVRGANLDDPHLVFTLLLGCQVASVSALAWLCGRQRIGGGPLLGIQSWLGLVGMMVLAAILFVDLLVNSGAPVARFEVMGGVAGCLALAVSVAAAFWQVSLSSPHGRLHVAGLGLLACGVLAGCLANTFDTQAHWVSYQVMVGFWGVLALLMAVGGSLLPLKPRPWQEQDAASGVSGWLGVFAGLLALLAVIGGAGSSARPFTPIGAALAASMLTGALALWFRNGGFAHASGLLCILAAFLTWVAWGPTTTSAALMSIVIGLSLAATFWQVMDLPWLRLTARPMRWSGLPFAPLACSLALLLLASVVGFVVAIDARGDIYLPLGGLAWLALLAVALALAAALGNPDNRQARPELYLFGLVFAGLVLHQLELPPQRLGWAVALALAVQVVVASVVLWFFGSRLPRLQSGEKVTIGLSVVEREWPWFLPVQAILAGFVALLGFTVAVDLLPLEQRVLGPLALALLVPAALILARVAPGDWPGSLQVTAASTVVAALAALAWAVPDPHGVAPWLQRDAWLLAAMTLSCIGVLEGLTRRLAVISPGPAKEAERAGLLDVFCTSSLFRRLGVILGCLAMALALVLLGQMFPQFDKLTKRTPLQPPAIAAVALSLAALVALALHLALRPERDPLRLSEGWRTAYVYLAEVLVVLLFVHVRLNVPELFSGLLARYWTLMVLLIAFLGVGASELFERYRLRVLAVPLQRTGIFLPLIPILAFWARPPAALITFADENAPGMRPLLANLQATPWSFDSHALVWFLSAALYGLVALARRSIGWAIAAALAANFGLWALLMHAGIGFLVHPQAWIIPLGLIILVSEHINHERLTREGSQALRYLGISLIYVASTADLFLTGLGNSLWLPIILAVLCVAGVLLGILLRVRAFLFLGVGFLLVDVFSMIWHAAVDLSHTWLWWACGIVLGAAILALFALFEKRRNMAEEVLDRFKAWE